MYKKALSYFNISQRVGLCCRDKLKVFDEIIVCLISLGEMERGVRAVMLIT